MARQCSGSACSMYKVKAKAEVIYWRTFVAALTQDRSVCAVNLTDFIERERSIINSCTVKMANGLN